MQNGTLDERFAAFAELLKFHLMHCKGEPTVITTAPKMDLPPSTLYAYANADRSFPLNQLVPLIKATGEFDFLRWFAHQVGCDIYTRPEPGAASKRTVLDQLLITTRENTEAAQAVLTSIDDGELTHDELARISTEINEAARELEQLKVMVNASAMAARGGHS